ncbi:hypothetical protein [Sphingobium sp. LSP13-1-1.1]|uniref:hypothetical protein n=1 Tax=Sphingobium sp. LSP13-1-1.1 TaxID=3135234 RepID=UPI00341F0ABB
MVALPNQGMLTVPIQWNTEVEKTEIQAAGYRPSVTKGWRSWTDTATLAWSNLTADEVKTMLDLFRSTNFNGVFDYTCKVNGAIRIQLNGPAMFTEEGGKKLHSLSISVRRVS